MDAAQKLKQQVRDEFMEYLTLHKHRKTPERFAILDHIYSTKGHFDMDSLYKSMIEVNFRVSRATLYNTIQLLLDCGLVVKHQFGANISKYERAHGNENHDHLICTTCGEVREMTGDLLTPAQLKKIRKFKVSYYSTYIYGTCSKCIHAKRMEMKRLERENEEKRQKSAATAGKPAAGTTGKPASGMTDKSTAATAGKPAAGTTDRTAAKASKKKTKQ